MYIVSIVMIMLIVMNYVLSFVLYQEPTNKEFFDNVRQMNTIKNRYIYPNPKYVLLISVLMGIVAGIYIALAKYYGVVDGLVTGVMVLLSLSYLAEVTQKVTLEEDKLTYSQLFFLNKTFEMSEICGMYIYTYRKNWLKQYALTTKMVVTNKQGKKFPFIISGLSNKKIFNMMKDNFGIVDHKMYVAKYENKK